MSQATREKFNLPPLNVSKPAAPLRRPVWDAARGLWMLDGVAVDPQPAAPQPTVVFERAIQRVNLADGLRFEPGKTSIDVPPSVKVSA